MLIERTCVTVRTHKAGHNSCVHTHLVPKTQTNVTSFKMDLGNKNYHVYGRIQCYKPQHFSLTEQKQLYNSLRQDLKLAPSFNRRKTQRSFEVWKEIRAFLAVVKGQISLREIYEKVGCLLECAIEEPDILQDRLRFMRAILKIN